MRTRPENEKRMSKDELLTGINAAIDKRIENLKGMLVENILSGADLLGLDSNLIKERIRIYQKMRFDLCEIINEMYEMKEVENVET